MDFCSLVRTMRPAITPMRFARRLQSSGAAVSDLTTETKRFGRSERRFTDHLGARKRTFCVLDVLVSLSARQILRAIRFHVIGSFCVESGFGSVVDANLRHPRVTGHLHFHFPQTRLANGAFACGYVRDCDKGHT